MNNLITLFTDASFCTKTHVGAFAAWAKFNGETVRKSGVLKARYAQSNEAELAAIANGIFMATAAFKLAPNGAILVQSDCEAALLLIKSQRKNVSNEEKKIMKLIWKRLTDAKLRILTKHVKGHAALDNVRSFVNTWCDKEAFALMKAAQKDFLEKKA